MERREVIETIAFTTHQLQVERREVIEPIKCMRSHTPATGGEERESHRANQVYALTHTSYRWRGERVIEPIKCMPLTTHQPTGG